MNLQNLRWLRVKNVSYKIEIEKLRSRRTRRHMTYVYDICVICVIISVIFHMSCVICHMCLWKCLWYMSYICHRHRHVTLCGIKNMRWEIKNAKEWNKKLWDARLKKCKAWDITCEMHGWLVPGCLEKRASKKSKMRDVKGKTRNMRDTRLKWRCEVPGKTFLCQILDFWYCVL